jgi:hypothetical protein
VRCHSSGFPDGIGRAKDLAAGAVFVCAAVSAAVGIIIFINGDKLALALAFTQNHIVWTVLIALTIPASIFFIVGRRKT